MGFHIGYFLLSIVLALFCAEIFRHSVLNKEWKAAFVSFLALLLTAASTISSYLEWGGLVWMIAKAYFREIWRILT